MIDLLDAEPVENSDDVAAELPHFVEEVRSQWRVPGVAMAVVRDGAVVFSGGFGNLESLDEARLPPRAGSRRQRHSHGEVVTLPR